MDRRKAKTAGGYMTLTEDEVIQILRLVEASSFDELHLETGDLKLVVRKKGCGAVVTETDAASTRREPARHVSTNEPVSGLPDAGLNKDGRVENAPQEAGGIPIKAPLLGTVYRRPAPEAPPYVEAGSHVKEDDTVCLIEVMKVFTVVKAGVSGYITEILIESNQMVEYGQPLFMVKPDL